MQEAAHFDFDEVDRRLAGPAEAPAEDLTDIELFRKQQDILLVLSEFIGPLRTGAQVRAAMGAFFNAYEVDGFKTKKEAAVRMRVSRQSIIRNRNRLKALLVGHSKLREIIREKLSKSRN